jgi:hypothetical protein
MIVYVVVIVIGALCTITLALALFEIIAGPSVTTRPVSR